MSEPGDLEITPLIGVPYVPLNGAGPDGVNLYRWQGGNSDTPWQRIAGWIGCPSPGKVARLIYGPMLVEHITEPVRDGAVVEEALTGRRWVRVPTTSINRWAREGVVVAWKEIRHPILIGKGVL